MAGNGARAGGGRQAGGAVAEAKSFTAPSNDFYALKRRYDRTRPIQYGAGQVESSTRPARLGRKYPNQMSFQDSTTRRKALEIYTKQATRPGALAMDQVRAPLGRFSTVSNPAPKPNRRRTRKAS